MDQDSDDYESEDVVIEFEGNFDFDGVAGKSVKIVGIDSKEPVLQIDTKFYKIDIQDSIGTRLLFKHGQEDGKLVYYGKTDKVATAHRIMLKEKSN